MIVIDPIEQIIGTPKTLLNELLPRIFNYLKCYLPLANIKAIILNKFQIRLTTHQLFHMVFQLSDPLLRGFCIEHYSYGNPVPLYYAPFATHSKREFNSTCAKNCGIQYKRIVDWFHSVWDKLLSDVLASHPC